MSSRTDETIVSDTRVPRTKRTKQKKKNKSNTKKKFRGSLVADLSSSSDFTETDLIDHIYNEYSFRDNGEFKTIRKRTNRSEKAALKSRMEMGNPQHQIHVDYLKLLNKHPTLVLNADYQPLSYLPLSLWSWQDAVKAVFGGKVTVVDTYKDVRVRAVSIEMMLPSVIALNVYQKPNAKRTDPSFTRRNVFLRDGYKCQYCHRIFRNTDLSLDHYVPRCKGGKLEW